MFKPGLRKILIAFIASVAIMAAAASGLFYRVDNAASDSLYQSPKALDGNIFVIGIDAYALETIGPYQTWGREIMAQAIDALNADPDNRPAVIGIDVLYTGYTNEDADSYLAEAAGRHGNVVVASAANFSSSLVVEDAGNFYMDDFHIESFDEAYPELKSATAQGHINAMYDADGVLRHNMLYLNLPDESKIPSFAYSIYKLYAKEYGLEEELNVPVGERYNWYVPFSGNPGAYYDGFSVADLITGDITGDMFAGSIVLIGPYATGLSDNVITAIEHAENMYGVEYQANLLDALIRGEFKTEISNFPQYILLFIISFLLIFLFDKRGVLFCTLVWLAVSGGYIGLAYLAYGAGYVLHLIWIPLSATAIYISSVAANYIRAAIEKRRVTNTFKRYVAPEVVNEILKEGTDALDLGGKMTDIAVLFVDIRGFTTMSEALTPPEVVEILNKYLTLTSSCIMKNGGMLDKFVGDATMALFNAPLPQEDYIFKAVKTALDMVDGSKALSEELLKQCGRTVSFGIGIHCGPAVVGNIGAEMRMDYTAIGDTVNTAARLEANAPGGTVYISRAVADALSGRIKATSLGATIKLKGKAEGFEILTLDGLLDEINYKNNYEVGE